jgi:hypothetical protein
MTKDAISWHRVIHELPQFAQLSSSSQMGLIYIIFDTGTIQA